MDRPTTTRRRHRRRLLALTPLAALGLLATVCGPMPEPPPPTNGSDLTIRVQGARAEIGSTATYQAIVSSVGTQDSVGPVTATVVAPPGQTVSGAIGSGWTCDVVPASTTCTTPTTVGAGTSLPAIIVTTDVGGSPFAASTYGAVSVAGDVNAVEQHRSRYLDGGAAVRAGPALHPAGGGPEPPLRRQRVELADVTITSDSFGPQTMDHQRHRGHHPGDRQPDAARRDAVHRAGHHHRPGAPGRHSAVGQLARRPPGIRQPAVPQPERHPARPAHPHPGPARHQRRRPERRRVLAGHHRRRLPAEHPQPCRPATAHLRSAQRRRGHPRWTCPTGW